MADVAAAPSQPKPIPNSAGITGSTPNSLPLPSTTKSNRSGNLTLDTFSPVQQNGSFDFDRIIKSGEVFKRTRKTKSWKPIFIVLRPNLLSIYPDKNESKLRHQVNLSDLTAVARQKDPKRKEKYIFGLFSPSRNYHLSANSDQEAQDWVDLIRREARFDENEEEMYLASPGGANTSSYQGFERMMATRSSASPGAEDRGAGYASSSDADGLSPSLPVAKTRDRVSVAHNMRQPSYAEYSGAERGSMSDFSDLAGPASRLSALSLTQTTDPRPSTSSAQPPQLSAIYGQPPTRPAMGARNVSQMSVGPTGAQNPPDEERVLFHGWVYLLKTRSGVRQWKKVWLVLRSRALALYKNEEEYTALLIISFSNIIDAVEIDPISRSKTFCMQIISDERNYRFCTMDEESLAKCLGALKSLLSKRKARRKEKEAASIPPVAVNA